MPFLKVGELIVLHCRRLHSAKLKYNARNMSTHKLMGCRDQNLIFSYSEQKYIFLFYN
jgi:hypothetical protein